MSKAEREAILEDEDMGIREAEERDEQPREEEPKVEKKPKPPSIIEKGILKLKMPLIGDGKEVTELKYDFTTLTGKDLIRVLDSRVKAEVGNGEDGLNARKAKLLFAEACGRQQGLDPYDIEDRLGFADSLTAIQLGKSFYVITLQAGSRNIKSL